MASRRSRFGTEVLHVGSCHIWMMMTVDPILLSEEWFEDDVGWGGGHPGTRSVVTDLGWLAAVPRRPNKATLRNPLLLKPDLVVLALNNLLSHLQIILWKFNLQIISFLTKFMKACAFSSSQMSWFMCLYGFSFPPVLIFKDLAH